MNYVGIDIGGTNIAVGVIDEGYSMLYKASVKTPNPFEAESSCELIAHTVRDVLAHAGLTLDDVAYIGAGVPGSVDKERGIVIFSSNVGMKEHFPLRELLEKKFEKPVYVANDANAAAFGEFMSGALKGAENAVAITLGTGIGGGIIIGRKIYTGTNFIAGEVGHTVIHFGGRQCKCGRLGCWERYASASGLIISTKEAMEADRASKMWDLVSGDITRVNGRTAFSAMRLGDASAKRVVDEYAAYLACGITNVINDFQPDILCIGGGISNEGEALLAPVRAIVERDCHLGENSNTVICKAKLGNDAGIIGAALLGEE